VVSATTQNSDGTTTIVRATVITSVTDGEKGTTYSQSVNDKQSITVDPKTGQTTYGASTSSSGAITREAAAVAFGNGAGGILGNVAMANERFQARMQYSEDFNHNQSKQSQDRIGRTGRMESAGAVLRHVAEAIEALARTFE
jgi:hypothetical protein